jgi:ferredoxin-type protein NapF
MQFLRGDFTGKQQILRPPWSVDEALFVELCTTCGDCIRVCPTGILTKGRGAYPVVDFTNGECEFCEKCVAACKPLALRYNNEPGEQSWQVKALISNKCLAQQGIVCRSCAEQCEPRAIVFTLSAGSAPQPLITIDKCTGCGACLSSCPVNALSIALPLTQEA